MNRAIFWDRDGVLNEVVAKRHDGLSNVSPLSLQEFFVREGVAEVLATLHDKGFLNIVVTNQPDIARQKMSIQELESMHIVLRKKVPAIDAIYVCPHDTADACNCRKPKPGLLLQATEDFALELHGCYMIGDSQNDIDAARALDGVESVLLQTPYNSHVTRHYKTVKNLKDIIDFIV